ncbi:MAG: hypothetical protein ABR579_00975 [Actinomycetota bacterium]
MAFSWVVESADGKPLTTSERFASQEEAESWMGSEWSRLAEDGGSAVTLMDETEVVYKMSLEPE